jgi:hypothetical protein
MIVRPESKEDSASRLEISHELDAPDAIDQLEIAMSEDEYIRKTVGRKPECLTVFERLRRLNAFVRKLNIKHSDDGEHIRRVVGPSSRN